MGGLGNVFTKVGNGDALALMVAEANVFTHIGDGMSVALMLAKGNVATKWVMEPHSRRWWGTSTSLPILVMAARLRR